jgi:hypothetical protein
MPWLPLTDYEYHCSEKYRYHLTSSGHKWLLDGQDYWYYKRVVSQKDSTKDQHFYSAIHAYLFGGRDSVIFLDFKDYRTNAAKEAYKKALKDFPKQPIVLEPKRKAIEDTVDNIMENKFAAALLTRKDAIFETAGVFEIPGYQISGAIKPDLRIPSERWIIDGKALGKCTKSGFRMQCKKLKWPIQQYWYQFGAKIIDSVDYEFLFLGYETEPPFRAEVFRLVDMDTQAMHELIYDNIELFSYCVRENNFKREPGIIDIEAPRVYK